MNLSLDFRHFLKLLQVHTYITLWITVVNVMISSHENEDQHFTEFRHKVRSSELLSAAVVHLMRAIGFTGRV